MLRTRVAACLTGLVVAFAAITSLTAIAADTADGARAVPFQTKHAMFVPAKWSDLPGWHDDDLADAWKALRASCSVLATRTAWSGPCSRAAGVPLRNDAIRGFLETEFVVYQIQGTDRSASGIITGYYEPLLNGSRAASARYRYPVYGVPADLLYFDARAMRSRPLGVTLSVNVDGRNVVPLPTGESAKGFAKRTYRLDVRDGLADVRDKRIRVRIDGDRIVPYWTRAEINAGALGQTKPIAWVDSAADLYSMHVQGSGKLRLPDGRLLRVAFAEQNGHPFTPPLVARTRGGAPEAVPLLRGLAIDFAALDEPAADGGSDSAADAAPTTRGAKRPAGKGRAASGPSTTASDGMSPEVARMVDMLLRNQVTTPGVDYSNAGNAGGSAPAAGKSTLDAPLGATKPPPSHFGRPAAFFDSDPSYIFFREIPDSAAGPIGALGIPLTPGRSIAVDPRTTPLGFPVFIATQSRGGGINRLMLAQDTGGAIRGAVRADYFWGFGPKAGERASQMKDTGRMWLLMPRDVQPASMGVSTRGRGEAQDGECVVPDPEFCVE
jgi:membrane-bound lytic murein transglycosylase A